MKARAHLQHKAALPSSRRAQYSPETEQHYLHYNLRSSYSPLIQTPKLLGDRALTHSSLQHPSVLDNSGGSGNSVVWKVFSKEITNSCVEGAMENYSSLGSPSHQVPSSFSTALHLLCPDLFRNFSLHQVFACMARQGG